MTDLDASELEPAVARHGAVAPAAPAGPRWLLPVDPRRSAAVIP